MFVYFHSIFLSFSSKILCCWGHTSQICHGTFIKEQNFCSPRNLGCNFHCSRPFCAKFSYSAYYFTSIRTQSTSLLRSVLTDGEGCHHLSSRVTFSIECGHGVVSFSLLSVPHLANASRFIII